MISPRTYQLEALDAIEAHHKQQITKQLISLPTGCGKTVIFSLLAKKQSTKTLIIVHTEELLLQAVEKLKVVWPEADIGIVKSKQDQVTAQIVVASIQTASKKKRLQKLKEQDFKLMIIDECHHALASSYQSVIKELGFHDDQKLLVGVTATPSRGDGIGLKGVFDAVVFERSLSTMMKAGYLAPLSGKQIHTRTDLANVQSKHGDFIASQLAKVVNTPSRNDLIVTSYQAHASSCKKTLVFCADVRHAKDLADAFLSHGIKAKAIHGDMKKEERAQILKEFSSGETTVLTNCQILTEGFDEPSIDCIILARPTQSRTLFIQMLGRGTRLHPQKKSCFVLDFTDSSSKHQLCSYKNSFFEGVVTEVIPKEKYEESEALEKEEDFISIDLSNIATSEERIEELRFFNSSKFAWSQIGESWHLKLSVYRDIWLRKNDSGYLVIAHEGNKRTTISTRSLPLDYALGVAEDWARSQTTKSAWARKDAAWRQEPASSKQIQALKEAGYNLDETITRGEAFELLDKHYNKPTPAQIRFLTSKGIPLHDGVSKNEIKHLISQLKS